MTAPTTETTVSYIVELLLETDAPNWVLFWAYPSYGEAAAHVERMRETSPAQSWRVARKTITILHEVVE